VLELKGLSCDAATAGLNPPDYRSMGAPVDLRLDGRQVKARPLDAGPTSTATDNPVQ
jgi:hypothetical protein